MINIIDVRLKKNLLLIIGAEWVTQ